MGLENFILTCEKDNKELREDLRYYKNRISRLEKENKELKKQLEVGEQQYNELVEEKENLQEQLSSNILQLETQQKEFIKYLEECEEAFNLNHDSINASACKSILQRYKEITGEK